MANGKMESLPVQNEIDPIPSNFFGRMRILAALLLVTAMLEGCGEAKNKGNSLSHILSELDPSCPKPDRTGAIESLQQLGTNVFPLLVEEMNSFRWHTPE